MITADLTNNCNSEEKTLELRQQNASLAFALNQVKEENSGLAVHVNDLNAEILDLRGQLAGLKSKHEEDRSFMERLDEAEFQRRLAVSSQSLNVFMVFN